MTCQLNLSQLEAYLLRQLENFSSDLIDYQIDWTALKRNALRYDEVSQCVEIELEIGFACGSVIEALESEIEAHLSDHLEPPCQEGAGLNNELSFKIRVTQRIHAAVQLSKTPHIKGIKHIIAVASGKGGVGKSTTAVNLALALQQEGASVGLLDADIYGPSQQMLLGLSEDVRPELLGPQQWKPVSIYGISVMSMAFMITERTPMLWRGPMVSGALLQLLNNTQWPDLDYLIVDMPPGTGDIQLTMVQKVPITGAIIVTTPQDIALLDAKKGIEMFHRVGVPILGVVENMSTHRCSHCGHEEAIFGEGGGEAIAQLYHTPLLGRLPLERGIREQADHGQPIVLHDSNEPMGDRYRSIARAAAASLWHQVYDLVLPDVEILDD